MKFLNLLFNTCLRLRFQDVETIPGPQRSVPDVFKILSSNVQGLAGDLSDLTVASSQYDILFCSQIFADGGGSELVVGVGGSGFGRPVFLCQGKMPCLLVRGQDGCICTRWIQSISPTQIWVWRLRNVCF